MLTCSRIFGLTINGKETSLFVPYCEMLNHSTCYRTRWSFDHESQGFILKANRLILKGQQIFTTYGKKSNYVFLMYYGFYNLPNCSDHIPILLSIDTVKPKRGDLFNPLRELKK
jgi:protein-histidine N-methyltransferase